ncbi:hypothetical protein ANN_07356 [Periplaneta americana]|uniref:Mos1 transposase HTH domain-containing protein n=1 Tax=Periplaneta americana TaxID=6978 RepID=A0ABQ8SZM8_PERAM|nr:hypothetical protein ANN_07356 [Periplaneta americana]
MDTSSCMTASVPIPPRKMMDLSELRDFGFDFVDVSSSPSTSHDTGLTTTATLQGTSGLYPSLSGTSIWGARLNAESELNRTDTFRMDDDDIFQVDKADLIQGPTLAELNANDENLLEDLNFDDLLLPEENSYYINVPTLATQPRHVGAAPPMVQITHSNNNNNNNNTSQSSSVFTPSSFPPASLGFYKDAFAASASVPSSPVDPFIGKSRAAALSPTSQNSSSSSLLLHSAASVTPPPLGMSPLQQKHSTLHELLLKKEAFSVSPDQQLLGQSVPGPTAAAASPGGHIGRGTAATSSSSRLSSSAPTHLGLEQIWQRREPRQHLLSTGSLAEAGSTSSLSTGGVLSPESHDFSHDEGFDSDDDSDHYEDFSSDAESVSDGETSQSKVTSLTKKERYFWQYNVQAKGPKGQRLVLKTRIEDPHVLNEVTDPVFSPECSVRGIKHSGKARKGDGNDLTPNPRKLCNIGKELDKLGRIINDMTPVSELPFNIRPKTRKEKNKLASRSCLVPVAWQQWSEMEALIPSPATCEVRSVIKFFNAQSSAPIEIHRQLCQVYGPKIMSKQMVRRWCRQFSEGRQSVHDEERSGRPSLINDDRVEPVRQCIMENRRFTITELSSHFPQISRSLLHEIVTKHLLFKKVCARWVQKNLTPEHKMQRLGAALTFLQQYHDDGDEFLDRIVTGDETWISHFTPETKQQSMHWQHSRSPVRTKSKQTLSVRKVICTVFWDRKGILLIDFLPRGETVNTDRYCETLRKLRRAIQNKRRGMLTAGIVLLHDNARCTAAVLTEFGWELFHHPPYSPDLAPSDFHVFLHLKKFLSSDERFGNDELKTACRLKKKAQHEANKLKLYGLEQEHKRLNSGISQVKQVLAAKFTADSQESQEELTRHIEKVVKTATKLKIAGYTTDFVNRVLDRVKSGVPGGGLDEL